MPWSPNRYDPKQRVYNSGISRERRLLRRPGRSMVERYICGHYYLRVRYELKIYKIQHRQHYRYPFSQTKVLSPCDCSPWCASSSELDDSVTFSHDDDNAAGHLAV